MRKLIFIVSISILFLLSGCKNNLRDARAAEVRAQTRRTNDKHELAMADSQALTSVRLATKEGLLWLLMISSSVVVVAGAGSLVWLMVGGSVNTIRHQRTQQVPLDVATRQYPLLIYGNGRRVFNPNNGERLLLSECAEAGLLRVEASTQVQLAGLIADGSKIINGEVR